MNTWRTRYGAGQLSIQKSFNLLGGALILLCLWQTRQGRYPRRAPRCLG